MSDRDSIPTGKLAQLKHSVGTLMDQFGRAPPVMATAINVVTVLVGVAIWHYTTGVVSFSGAVLAIMAAGAILKWAVMA